MMIRIIIAGSRDFCNYKLLVDACYHIFSKFVDEKLIPDEIGFCHDKVEIISGKAKGADTLGEKFAKEFNLQTTEFPAKWSVFGKSAGYRRNEEMAKYAKQEYGVLIAFWDGQSKGTKHMINLAKKHNLRVFVVDYINKTIKGDNDEQISIY